MDFLKRWIGAFLDVRRALSLRFLPRYALEWSAFRRLAGGWPMRFSDSFPALWDRVPTTPYDPHYFRQGNWIARRLAQAKPARHVDVGSSILTVGVLSAHVPTVFVDYRPLMVRESGLDCIAGNITQLPFADGSLPSLSCLHVLEHIGLGRYGDPLDGNGANRAASELQRVLAVDGTLYISTPIGRERICFNAHRVFAPKTIIAMFAPLKLVQFSFISDDGALHSGVTPAQVPPLDYGCGLFEFRR